MKFINYDDNLPSTEVSRAVAQDKRLSWKARGLFCYICSIKPKIFYVNDLVKGASNGYEATTTAIDELIHYGYVKRYSSPTRGNGCIPYCVAPEYAFNKENQSC